MAAAAAPLASVAASKIVCIGRNYAAHAAELSNAVPSAPFFFLKPPSSVVWGGESSATTASAPIVVPPDCEVHHEVELALVVGRRCRRVDASRAHEFIGGYRLALDLTARNLQADAKARGLPWSAAKGFDTFCPLSPTLVAADAIDARALASRDGAVRLWLRVNDDAAPRQDGSTADMIFGVGELLAHVSSVMTLERGDLLLTGTPAGVGALRDGDVVVAGMDDARGRPLASFRFDVRGEEKL